MSNAHEDTLAILEGKKGKGRTPGWDEREKFLSTKRIFRVLIVFGAVVWIALIVWVFVTPIENLVARALPVGADLAIVLAPIIAAAAGVERLLETIFNTLEGNWKTMVAYLGYGFRWLKSAELEVSEARQWLSNTSAIFNSTSAQYNKEMSGLMKLAADPDKPQLAVTNLPPEVSQRMSALAEVAAKKTAEAQLLMQAAQNRLSAAENKLGGITGSAGYRSAKAAMSIVLGLMLGVVTATVGQLQMFALLGIDLVPAHIDVLITGLIIGTGSAPVHSLVGILQQGKNTLDNLSGYLNSSSSAKKSESVATRAETAVTMAVAAPVMAAAADAAASGQPVSFGLPTEPSSSQSTQPPATPGPLG